MASILQPTSQRVSNDKMSLENQNEIFLPCFYANVAGVFVRHDACFGCFSTLPIIAGKSLHVVSTFSHVNSGRNGSTQPFLQIAERDFTEKVSTFGLDKPFTASDVCGQAKAVFSAAHDGSANMAELCSTTSNASFGHRILSLTLLNDHGA